MPTTPTKAHISENPMMGSLFSFNGAVAIATAASCPYGTHMSYVLRPTNLHEIMRNDMVSRNGPGEKTPEKK